MPLTKFEFRPGIVRDVTKYSNEGGWVDGNLIRFRFGFPEKMAGWQKLNDDSTFLGTCRALHTWLALDSSRYVGVGTHLKYYINEGGGYYDITPVRSTTAAGEVTFAAAANTLAAGVAIGDDEIELTSSSGFPSQGTIEINSEIITYTGISSNTLTGCSRGQYGTTEAAHSATDAVNCATLTVSDVAHGAGQFDFVTFSGATTLGDAITAHVLNQEYQIDAIVDTDTYLVTARTTETIEAATVDGELSITPVFATSSDSGNGGASVVGEYQILTGRDSVVSGTGWGAGTWSRGTWGSASGLTATSDKLRIWTHDNFGEDLLLNVRDGGIYYWDKTSLLSSRAVELSSLSNSNFAPTVAKQILVSDTDRHVIAFGCDPQSNPGVQDALLIRFSDQENLREWESTATTTAGELRIGSGSEIICAVETRQQILVFTDTSLHIMQYLGPPFTFGLQLVSENTHILSPNAAVALDDMVFWVGGSEFYVYNGLVERLPCTVRDYVFDDINVNQLDKVTAGLNSENSEVWWFYPSSGSEENDRYVVYNVVEQAWYYGSLPRTSWLDRGTANYPIAASTDGHLYYHELGLDDGSTDPASGLDAFVESAPLDLGDGQQFTFIRRLIPDVSITTTTGADAVDIKTSVRNHPQGDYLRSTTSEVASDTELVHLRLRGRQMNIRVGTDHAGVDWRLGSLRYDIQPDGRK